MMPDIDGITIHKLWNSDVRHPSRPLFWSEIFLPLPHHLYFFTSNSAFCMRSQHGFLLPPTFSLPKNWAYKSPWPDPSIVSRESTFQYSALHLPSNDGYMARGAQLILPSLL